MADDGSVNIKPTPAPNAPSFGDVARHELALTARAFFAPVVGTYAIMRSLLQHEADELNERPDFSVSSSPEDAEKLGRFMASRTPR